MACLWSMRTLRKIVGPKIAWPALLGNSSGLAVNRRGASGSAPCVLLRRSFFAKKEVGLFKAAATDDVSSLSGLLASQGSTIFNRKEEKNGGSLLHVAVLNHSRAVVDYLLSNASRELVLTTDKHGS